MTRRSHRSRSSNPLEPPDAEPLNPPLDVEPLDALEPLPEELVDDPHAAAPRRAAIAARHSDRWRRALMSAHLARMNPS